MARAILRRKALTDCVWHAATVASITTLVLLTNHVINERVRRGLVVKSLLDELQSDPSDYVQVIQDMPPFDQFDSFGCPCPLPIHNHHLSTLR